MRLFPLVLTFILFSSVSLASLDYPPITFYGNFTEGEKHEIIKSIILFEPEHFKNVKRVDFYSYDYLKKGKYVCGSALAEDYGGFYCKNGRMIVDKKGIDYDLNHFLYHELTHAKCWKKERSMSHDSKCFTNGLV